MRTGMSQSRLQEVKLQKALGFYLTRNIPPPDGAGKQVPPCVGLCWSFVCLYLIKKKEKKRKNKPLGAPCSLPGRKANTVL